MQDSPQTHEPSSPGHKRIMQEITPYNCNRPQRVRKRTKIRLGRFLAFRSPRINSTPQKSIKFSPFFLVHGKEPATTSDINFPEPPTARTSEGYKYAEKLQLRLREARILATQPTKRKTSAKRTTTRTEQKQSSNLATSYGS